MGQIDDLRSAVVTRKGFAHPNRFSISFPALRGELASADDKRDIEFFCESASIPGRQILTLDYNTTRQTTKKPNGYANEDITLVFNLTNDYFIRELFRRWTNAIINRSTYELGYKRDYCTDVEINQLDEQNNKVYTVILRDAYPVTVQNIDLNNTTESGVQKMSVTLTYYDFVETKGQPIDDLPSGYHVGPVQEPREPRALPEAIKLPRNPKGSIEVPGYGAQPNPIPIQRRRPPTIDPNMPPIINIARQIAREFGFDPSSKRQPQTGKRRGPPGR